MNTYDRSVQHLQPVLNEGEGREPYRYVKPTPRRKIKADIIKLLIDGVTQLEIARRLECTQSYVSAVCKKARENGASIQDARKITRKDKK